MGGGGSGGVGGCTGTSCCVKVAPDGDDVLAEASLGQSPFRNIQPAIDFADSHRAQGTRVCVANGPDCPTSASYSGPNDGDLRMRNGISVYGGYESTSFARCEPLTTTTLLPTTAAGVLFEADVQSETTLDGFSIEPFAATATAGITARGASGVKLVGVRLIGEDYVDWLGVDLLGADATITDFFVDVSEVTNEAIGIRAVSSRVVLDGFATIGVHASSGTAYGIWLEESPDSKIDASITATNGVGATAVGALRVTGDADGVEVTQSNFSVLGQTSDTVGVFLDECAGAAPVIVDTRIAVDGVAAAAIEGVRSIGDCHPRIEGSTIEVRGANAGRTTGVRCEPGTEVPSACVLVDNEIRTANARAMPGPSVYGTGVACGPDSCESIERNTIIGLDVQNAGCFRSCYYEAIGVDLSSTSTFVSRNVIRAGCGDRAAGIRAGGSPTEGRVRIENNLVFGRQCGSMSDGVFTSAAIVSGADIDVHSNTLDGGGSTQPVSSCSSAAVIGGLGAYRNNVFLAGVCPERYGFSNTTLSFYPMMTMGGFPSALANNDFDPTNVTTLYLVDSMTTITTIGGVNQLPFASNNLSAAPLFTADHHLTQGSLCIDAGTTDAAPALDLDGQARDLRPDVGADEWVPSD
jgi:hypothetical protein